MRGRFRIKSSLASTFDAALRPRGGELASPRGSFIHSQFILMRRVATPTAMKPNVNTIECEGSLNEMMTVAIAYLELGHRPIPLIPLDEA